MSFSFLMRWIIYFSKTSYYLCLITGLIRRIHSRDGLHCSVVIIFRSACRKWRDPDWGIYYSRCTFIVAENLYTCKQCCRSGHRIPRGDGTLQVSDSYNFRIDTCCSEPAPNDGSRSAAASINLALCHGPFISVFFACPCATLQLNVSESPIV